MKFDRWDAPSHRVGCQRPLIMRARASRGRVRHDGRGFARGGVRIAASGAVISAIDSAPRPPLVSRGRVRPHRRRTSAPRARRRRRTSRSLHALRPARSLGCQADAVTSAAEGLERLEPGVYDVLLTDFGMPGMNGVELVERARARDAALRVIMLTASVADLDPAAQRLRFTLLRKPRDLARLRVALADA